ncbi:MAG: hypothetical protein BGO31_01110 [Bacteroidetes bacterium 43-16]|nr:MAG: hypothetical protein BGO31_01110 [Bacteroidetes bacterium 43-16]
MCIKAAVLPAFTLDDFDTKNIGMTVSPLGRTVKQLSGIEAAHRQLYYSIILCSKGTISISVDQLQIELQAGNALCIGSGSVSSMSLSAQASGWLIQFSPDFILLPFFEKLDRAYSCFAQNSYCLHTLSKQEMVNWQFYCHQMQREYLDNGSMAVSVLRSYLNILLEMINRNTDQARSIRKVTEKDRKLNVFEQLVEEKFSSQKLPSQYAAEMFVSVNYLNRICQETKGQSSGEIIRKRISLEAERLLCHTGKTVSEIAHELGFESLSYFVTFFKKQKGLSPEQYRKQNT